MSSAEDNDRWVPVGRWVSLVTHGRPEVRRFVYDADVERVACDLIALYPEARSYPHDLATAIRLHILLMGPEHPELIAQVAEDLGCTGTGAHDA